MKKRIAVLTLAIMMSLGVTSVVRADQASYVVHINNYDYSPSLRKINDTNVSDANWYCQSTTTGVRLSYNSSVWSNKSTRIGATKTVSSGSIASWKLAKRDDGNIQLRLENRQTVKVSISGTFNLRQ